MAKNIDTDFYNTKDSNEGELFFQHVLVATHQLPYSEDCMCMNRGQPRTDLDEILKEYHMYDCSVFVNKDPNAEANITITGRKESRDLVRVKLEEMTGIKLEEVDILSGE